MSSTRAATTAAVEQAGIVAVIRIKEPARLRAVVDALAEGGLRAIEVTMTVPGAIGADRRAVAAHAGGLPARRWHGHRRRHRAARRSTPARASSSARCSAARWWRPAMRWTCAAMPGCFTPTEILDAWEAGADIVKVFPATALGPRLHQGRPRPAAAGEADADRRRHARQRRRLDSRRRGRRRRRHGAASTPRRLPPATTQAARERRAHRRQRARGAEANAS